MEDLTEEKRALLQETPFLHQLWHLIPEGQPSQRGVKVIEVVSHKWQCLALSLRFEKHLIRIIETNYRNDCEAACRDMFRRWLQGRDDTRQPVTWDTLIRSLYETGTFETLGNKLVHVLCEMKSEHVRHSSQAPPNGDLPRDIEVDNGPVLKEGKSKETVCHARVAEVTSSVNCSSWCSLSGNNAYTV